MSGPHEQPQSTDRWNARLHGRGTADSLHLELGTTGHHGENGHLLGFPHVLWFGRMSSMEDPEALLVRFLFVPFFLPVCSPPLRGSCFK